MHETKRLSEEKILSTDAACWQSADDLGDSDYRVKY